MKGPSTYYITLRREGEVVLTENALYKGGDVFAYFSLNYYYYCYCYYCYYPRPILQLYNAKNRLVTQTALHHVLTKSRRP